MPNDAAITALSAFQSTSLDGVSTAMKEAFGLFTSALRTASPDAQFTSRDIVAWAQHYEGIKKEEDPSLPGEMLNAFSLGKIMKRHQLVLGITEIGSYGNRPIYCLQEQTPNVGGG